MAKLNLLLGRPNMKQHSAASHRSALDGTFHMTDKQENGRWANNRVENRHLRFRRWEKAMLRFRQEVAPVTYQRPRRLPQSLNQARFGSPHAAMRLLPFPNGSGDYDGSYHH